MIWILGLAAKGLQIHCIIFDIGGCDKQAAFYNPEFASYQQIRKMYAIRAFVLGH